MAHRLEIPVNWGEKGGGTILLVNGAHGTLCRQVLPTRRDNATVPSGLSCPVRFDISYHELPETSKSRERERERRGRGGGLVYKMVLETIRSNGRLTR